MTDLAGAIIALIESLRRPTNEQEEKRHQELLARLKEIPCR